MSVSPDGHYVYSGSADGSLYMYDFFSGHLKRTLRTSKHPCLAVDCHSQFHNVVATSSWKGEIYVFH